MVKVIPARIENGQIVPEAPLPPSGEVRSVTIHVEVAEPVQKPPKESTLPRLLGILRGYTGDAKQEYHEYLERKYR
jgi:hypothetical protein